MTQIRTAAAMPAATGWMMAAELDNDYQHQAQRNEVLLSRGRYVATLNRIDCEGCAAAVESAVRKIRGVDMAGASPLASRLVFEIGRSGVTVSDIRDVLASVSEALGTVIQLSGLRGPLPVVFSV